jgi:hypothetical protein
VVCSARPFRYAVALAYLPAVLVCSVKRIGKFASCHAEQDGRWSIYDVIHWALRNNNAAQNFKSHKGKLNFNVNI